MTYTHRQVTLDDGRQLFPLVQKLLRELAKRPDHNPEELGAYRRQAQRLMGRCMDSSTSNASFDRARAELIDLWLQVNDDLS